jgi:hypothetical protein
MSVHAAFTFRDAFRQVPTARVDIKGTPDYDRCVQPDSGIPLISYDTPELHLLIYRQWQTTTTTDSSSSDYRLVTRKDLTNLSRQSGRPGGMIPTGRGRPMAPGPNQDYQHVAAPGSYERVHVDDTDHRDQQEASLDLYGPPAPLNYEDAYASDGALTQREQMMAFNNRQYAPSFGFQHVDPSFGYAVPSSYLGMMLGNTTGGQSMQPIGTWPSALNPFYSLPEPGISPPPSEAPSGSSQPADPTTYA